MRKLIIDKFGPVDHAEIEIKRFNLFIGEQSIGKSTIAKLITILTDHLNLMRLLLGGATSWKELLEEYSLSAFTTYQPYKIDYTVKEQNYEAHLLISKSEFNHSFKVDGEEVTNPVLISNTLAAAKPIFHLDEIVIKSLNTNKDKKDGKNQPSAFDLLRDSLYVPAERNIVSSISKLQPAIMLAGSLVEKNLLRFIVEVNNAREYQSNWEIPILDISYYWENNEDYFSIKGRKTKWPLRIASSGIQSLLPLYVVINYALKKKEYSSYVIEEPECNLFPNKQIELLKFLLKNVSSPNMTLTVTTHSPYLLSAMNNYLFAGSIVEEFGPEAKKDITDRVGNIPIIKESDCSVYSLGTEINNGVYCKNIIDKETSMIDANSLDGVSMELSNEFDDLDDYLISSEKTGK